MTEESGEGHFPLLIRWEALLGLALFALAFGDFAFAFCLAFALGVSLAAIFFVSPFAFGLGIFGISFLLIDFGVGRLLLVSAVFSVRNSRGSQEHRSNQYT